MKQIELSQDFLPYKTFSFIMKPFLALIENDNLQFWWKINLSVWKRRDQKLILLSNWAKMPLFSWKLQNCTKINTYLPAKATFHDARVLIHGWSVTQLKPSGLSFKFIHNKWLSLTRGDWMNYRKVVELHFSNTFLMVIHIMTTIKICIL